MATEATSAVTIVLNLAGQRAAVLGLTQTSEAVAKLAATVTDANSAIIDSTTALAAKTATAYQAQADEAEAAAARIATAQGVEVKSNADLVAASTATADAVEANFAKQGAAANLLRVRTLGAFGTADTAGKGTGVLGLLTSMRTLVTGGIVYESIKFFDSYQTALVKLGTQAGLTSSQIAQVSRQIQSQAVNLRTLPTQMASAYYNPISEGWSVAQSANVVARAAQLANMSGAPLSGQEGTSYTLSTMMQTLGMRPTKANALKMAAFIRGGVSTGDMLLPQLIAANSTGYFNTTQAFGIAPQSAMGILDFFSSQGVSPESAATRMRMTLAMMAAPTNQAAKYYSALKLSKTDVTGMEGQLASLGLTSTKMAGLLRTPNGINAAVAAVVQASSSLSPDMREALYTKLFGGGRSSATFLSLANHPALSEQTYQRVGAQSTTSGFLNAVNTWDKTISAGWKELAAAGSLLGTEIGGDLIPVLGGTLRVVTPLVADLAKSKLAVAGLATVLGGSLVVMVGTLTKALGTALINGLGGMIDGAVNATRSLLGMATAETAVGAKAALAGEELGGAGLLSGAGGVAALRGFLGWALPIVMLAAAAWFIDKSLPKKVREEGGKISLDLLGNPVPMGGTQFSLPPWLGNPNPQGNIAIPFSPHGAAPLPELAQHWIDNVGRFLGFASGGFMTNRPTAIVGEGNPAHPEFVIPTDPAYRARALGLYASLGTKLMAGGGELSGFGLSGAASDVLRHLVAGQSMSDSTGAMRAIDQAIGSSVPGGVVRSTLYGIVSTIFGALGRGVAGGGFGGLLSGGSGGSGGSVTGNQALGLAMAAAMGWTGNEWTALQMLWQRESGWSNTALNPRSGAYGIPQALPPTKMPFAAQAAGGSDARAQINWGLNYIKTRPNYGDPLAAWAHEQAMGWYAKGGVLPTARYDTGGFIPEGVSLAANYTGAPEFVPGPGSGPSGDLHVHLELDGREITQATIKNIREQVARR